MSEQLGEDYMNLPGAHKEDHPSALLMRAGLNKGALEKLICKGCAVYLICAHSNPGHQTVHPRAPNRRCPARAPDRAAERGFSERAQIDPHLRSRRLWQDHLGRRLGCRLWSLQTRRLAPLPGCRWMKETMTWCVLSAYLVAALQTILPGIGEGVLAALQSPQPPPTESILTALLNEISVFWHRRRQRRRRQPGFFRPGSG